MAEGVTPPAIARQLTEEKVLIPSAYTLQYHPEQCNRKAEYGCTSWNANTVREILSRLEYLGHTVLRKTSAAMEMEEASVCGNVTIYGGKVSNSTCLFVLL